jgi:hypothetical protein
MQSEVAVQLLTGNSIEHFLLLSVAKVQRLMVYIEISIMSSSRKMPRKIVKIRFNKIQLVTYYSFIYVLDLRVFALNAI